MAAVTVNESRVRPARIDQSIPPGVSGEALNAGDVVHQDAQGRWVKGAVAGQGIGINLTTCLAAETPVDVLRKGLLDIGNGNLQTLSGDKLYGTSAGALDTTATNNVEVGEVEVGRFRDGFGELRNYLRIDL